MSCDLVGSTALSERMDPEELHGLLAEYHRLCGEAVQAHGGHVAQQLGDGVLCYFGYPAADDARRAVGAALAILEGRPSRRPAPRPGSGGRWPWSGGCRRFSGEA